MNVTISVGNQILNLDSKTSVEELTSLLGTPHSDDGDWAERYVEFRIENTKLNLTWSKRNFLGKRFERLEEVSLELINEIANQGMDLTR